MAGETTKTFAICIGIRPWSQTSHIVTWLTPHGKIITSVKGAVRPKSAFLGQYDLNYTCEIVYYLHAKGEIHALRECTPIELRESLRSDYIKLLLAEHFRAITGSQAPFGPDAEEWFTLLTQKLDAICVSDCLLAEMLDFEITALKLAGLSPDIEAEQGFFTLRGERKIPIASEVAKCIANPLGEKKMQILLDVSRVISVFYVFHLDDMPKTRRYVIQALQQKKQKIAGDICQRFIQCLQ